MLFSYFLKIIVLNVVVYLTTSCSLSSHTPVVCVTAQLLWDILGVGIAVVVVYFLQTIFFI